MKVSSGMVNSSARKRGITLLLDETYKDFLPDGQRPHELFSTPDWRGTLVHLYSFSKVFALTGYRVGGVTAGASICAIIEEEQTGAASASSRGRR